MSCLRSRSVVVGACQIFFTSAHSLFIDNRDVDPLQDRRHHELLEPDPGYAHTLVTTVQVVSKASKGPPNGASTRMVVHRHPAVSGAHAARPPRSAGPGPSCDWL